MSKLIRADFARLWKSRVFWVCMAFVFVIGFFSVFSSYLDSVKYDVQLHYDDLIFQNCAFMPIVSAAFIGLFVGTDYSNGTIRNKLIVGNTRLAVYFSNLIVCAAALTIIHFTAIFTAVIMGAPLLGNRAMPVGFLMALGALSIITLIALTAVFLVMGMLISSKANASVWAIVLSIILFITAAMIYSGLSEPEYWEPFSMGYYDGETGEMISAEFEKEKNPYYVSGMKREVYEFLYDFLPSGQMVQVMNQEVDEDGFRTLPLYSLSIIVVATACGVIFFKRKNLN